MAGNNERFQKKRQRFWLHLRHVVRTKLPITFVTSTSTIATIAGRRTPTLQELTQSTMLSIIRKTSGCRLHWAETRWKRTTRKLILPWTWSNRFMSLMSRSSTPCPPAPRPGSLKNHSTVKIGNLGSTLLRLKKRAKKNSAFTLQFVWPIPRPSAPRSTLTLFRLKMAKLSYPWSMIDHQWIVLHRQKSCRSLSRLDTSAFGFWRWTPFTRIWCPPCPMRPRRNGISTQSKRSKSADGVFVTVMRTGAINQMASSSATASTTPREPIASGVSQISFKRSGNQASQRWAQMTS